MFSWVTSSSAWFGLLALTTLQVVLGVDNIVLITVLCRGLQPERRKFGRRLGVAVAMVSRLLLLAVIIALADLVKPFAIVFGHPISLQTIVFLLGGLFLIAKATIEMYHDVEHVEQATQTTVGHRLGAVMTQIFLLDIIFSLDQVITAVGLSNDKAIQVISVVLSVLVMLVFVNKLAHFIESHPSIRMLALSFLVLIGMSLTGQAFGYEFPKGYIYFAMVYALAVEVLNIRRRKNVNPPIL